MVIAVALPLLPRIVTASAPTTEPESSSATQAPPRTTLEPEADFSGLDAPEPETAPDKIGGDAATAPTDHRPPCPRCGGRMIIVETFERGSGPRDPPSPHHGIRTEAA